MNREIYNAVVNRNLTSSTLDEIKTILNTPELIITPYTITRKRLISADVLGPVNGSLLLDTLEKKSVDDSNPLKSVYKQILKLLEPGADGIDLNDSASPVILENMVQVGDIPVEIKNKLLSLCYSKKYICNREVIDQEIQDCLDFYTANIDMSVIQAELDTKYQQACILIQSSVSNRENDIQVTLPTLSDVFGIFK